MTPARNLFLVVRVDALSSGTRPLSHGKETSFLRSRKLFLTVKRLGLMAKSLLFTVVYVAHALAVGVGNVARVCVLVGRVGVSFILYHDDFVCPPRMHNVGVNNERIHVELPDASDREK